MSEKIDYMDPDASPGAGVRRVNNVPMYLFGAVLTAFLFIMALVATDRAAKQNAGESQSHSAGNTSMFAKEIAGDQTSGLIEPLMPPAEQNDIPPVLIARPENLNAPPKPPTEPIAHDDEADRIRMAKLQMLEEAVKAKTGVQIVAPRSAGSVPNDAGTPQTRVEMLARLAAVRQQIDAAQHDDPTAAYQARLEQIRSMGIGGPSSDSSTPSLLQTSTTDNKDHSYSQFAGSEGDRWKLDSKPEAPRTPYELRTGFVVPATLISGINSDLPGQIMAQVAQNVYDTPTGKYLLIPQALAW